MSNLQALITMSMTELALYGLVFLRVGAAMAFLPAFGDHANPVRIRLVLGLAFAVVVAPAVAGKVAVPAGWRDALPLLMTETLAGLALGFMLRLFVMAAEIAGNMAAQAGSLSQMFGGGGEPMPAFAHLLVRGATCLALMGGLHVKVAAALIRSYQVMPVGRLTAAHLIHDWTMGAIGQTFELAFSLAAPFLIAAFLYNAALGLVNRAMPALMVSMIGAPVLTGGALALLAICAPVILAQWSGAYGQFLANPFVVTR